MIDRGVGSRLGFHARLVVLVVLSASGVGCQSTPASEVATLSPSSTVTPHVPDFSGVWHITFHVDSCIGRYCSISQINRDQAMDVWMLQMGDHVAGRIGGVGVEGLVAVDGTLSLRGSAPSPSPYAPSFELQQFEVHLDPEHGLSGRLQYEYLMPGDRSAYSSGATGPILTATRQPMDATSFDGTWTGYYTLVSCGSPSPSACLFESGDLFSLAMHDSGGALTADLTMWPMRVALSGAASGSGAKLEARVPYGLGQTQDIVVRVQRTPVGLMTGTVEVSTSTGITATAALTRVGLTLDAP